MNWDRQGRFYDHFILRGIHPRRLLASMAEAYAEMYAGFAAGKIQPKGDRAEKGTTEIDEVIKTLIPN